MSKKKDLKRVPTNTSKEAKENPLSIFAEALIAGPNVAIENQEARGQQSFVNSETLPTDMGHHSGYDPKAILKKAGVKFGKVVEDDPLFQYVELPEGWKKVSTDHSMWSELVDDKGRKRASIFYKAAFYDRSAHMSLNRRFNYRKDYDRQDKEKVIVMKITDGDKIIHETEPIYFGEDREERYKAEDNAKKLVLSWLEENYPDWESPAAYWD